MAPKKLKKSPKSMFSDSILSFVKIGLRIYYVDVIDIVLDTCLAREEGCSTKVLQYELYV